MSRKMTKQPSYQTLARLERHGIAYCPANRGWILRTGYTLTLTDLKGSRAEVVSAIERGIANRQNKRGSTPHPKSESARSCEYLARQALEQRYRQLLAAVFSRYSSGSRRRKQWRAVINNALNLRGLSVSY